MVFFFFNIYFLMSFDFKIVQLNERFESTNEAVIIGLVPTHFIYGDRTDFLRDPDRTRTCRRAPNTWVEEPG